MNSFDSDTGSFVDAPAAAAQSRRATLAAYFGSVLEYYSFFIYASAAALVFGQVFFPAAGELSLLLSLASFGVAYVARPFGALFWGHFGDKLGRKRALILTLLMMGGATFSIAFIPSYGQIGVVAPILLVIMSILQGISAAGETAGAVSLVVESSGESKKAFNSSWIQSGNLAGFVLATLVFVPIAMLPDEQLMSWGWRIPFLFCSVLVVLGFVLRRKLDDSAEFIEAKSDGGTKSVSPLRELFGNHKRAILVLAALGVFQGTHSMVTVAGLAYATEVVELTKSSILWMLVVVSAIALVTVPFGGWLADRLGYKRVFLYGAIAATPAFALYMWSFTTENIALVYGTGIVVYSIVYSIGNGSTMALFANQFDVRVRYSGLAVGMQIAGLVYGFAPAISLALVGGDIEKWLYAVGVQAVMSIAAVIGCSLARGQKRTKVADTHPIEEVTAHA